MCHQRGTWDTGRVCKALAKPIFILLEVESYSVYGCCHGSKYPHPELFFFLPCNCSIVWIFLRKPATLKPQSTIAEPSSVPLTRVSQPPGQSCSTLELMGGCWKGRSPGWPCLLLCGQLSLASGLAQLDLQRLERDACSEAIFPWQQKHLESFLCLS